jgi:hypothetical protein
MRMEDRVILKWQARDAQYRPKANSWYIAIAVAAGGLAVAAVIVADYLFAVLSLLAGFTLMVVGSRRPVRQTYALHERYLAIGKDKIPYEKIKRFAIHEDEPRELTLEVSVFPGFVTIPLSTTDYRRVRTILKNLSIDEEEELDTFVKKAAEWMGL